MSVLDLDFKRWQLQMHSLNECCWDKFSWAPANLLGEAPSLLERMHSGVQSASSAPSPQLASTASHLGEPTWRLQLSPPVPAAPANLR